MYIKSKKYLKNRLNEFVSVSDLDISDLKDNLLPIIKGVDTYCWSYIKKRERNSSRVVSISLNTDSEFQRLFDAVKEANSVWKIYKYVPSTDLEVCFDYFDIQRFTDFKQLLEDPECRDIIEKEANVKFIFNSDRKNDLHLLAKERRRFRREQEKVNDIYSYFNYTWDENEALAAVTNKRHVWVVRTNEYPNLPALFFYPKSPINSKDEEELISKYSHKLATAYKYELRDPSVNAYWLARPCRYPWFKEHPMPDGSELIIKINESKNKLTNMNTLSRDRNTLKRLVESYGKKDVLNFVRRLNESANLSGYTSLQLADLIDAAIEDDDYTLDEVTAQIAEPWNAALRRANLEDGIAAGWEDMPDAEDVRDSGYFYMGISSQPIYMGVYLDLTYNGKETDVAPGIRIDERGRICPFVATSEGIYIIEEMTPDTFASTFKTLLSYQNKNRDIEELINRLFVVIDVEQ